MRQFKVSERITPRSSKAASLYLTEVDRTNPMDPETESKVAYLASQGDKKARELLVTSNLRFVISVAKMYAFKQDDFIDLVSAGNEGLYEASGKFDPTKGFKFISFAIWYIRKEMIKYLSHHSRTIRIPTNQSRGLKIISDTGGRLSAIEGRDISNEEALQFLKESDPQFKDMDSKLLSDVWLADLKPASLNAEIGSEKDAKTLLDVIPSDSDDSLNFISSENDKIIIKSLLSCLSPLEQDLIKKTFCIDNPDGFPISPEDLELETGISSTIITSMIRKSLYKMKNFATKSKFNHWQ